MSIHSIVAFACYLAFVRPTQDPLYQEKNDKFKFWEFWKSWIIFLFQVLHLQLPCSQPSTQTPEPWPVSNVPPFPLPNFELDKAKSNKATCTWSRVQSRVNSTARTTVHVLLVLHL